MVQRKLKSAAVFFLVFFLLSQEKRSERLLFKSLISELLSALESGL